MALHVSPKSREAKFMFASALRRNDQNEEAREVLEELLVEQKEARMLVVYAQVLSDLFMHDAAIEACTQAIQLSPHYHDAYLQRGLIRLLTGNFEFGF
jgi:tetratricopeptide (TPR) repeat protein